MEKLVVTRYRNLVTYLKELKLIDENTKVIARATISDVEGKHIFGVVPFWLAAHAEKFTEVQLRVPSDRKNKELTLEEVRFYSLDPQTYTIRIVDKEVE